MNIPYMITLEMERKKERKKDRHVYETFNQ